MSTEYLNATREVAFNYLRKTNKLLIINDKDDEFFHTFDDKYKVCNTLLIGSDYEDIPYVAGYSVTNLGYRLKQVYEDESLNSPVDVIYIDMTSQLQIDEYLDDSIDENTLIIVKLKNPVESILPPSLKKYKDNYYYIGDWDKDQKYDSQYYLILI